MATAVKQQVSANVGLTRYVQVSPVSQTPRLLLKIDEVAEALACNRSEVFKILKLGRLRSVGEGRSRRIVLADLEAYVATLIDASGSSAA